MQEFDIPDVLKIECISFTEPWPEYAFLREIKAFDSITRVAVFEDAIVGYVCANYMSEKGHILNLAVHPSFRRCGIATRLMEDVVHELREKGCKFLYLEVRASNLGARKFYERLGFRVTGVKRNYYVSPREDAVVMVFNL